MRNYEEIEWVTDPGVIVPNYWNLSPTDKKRAEEIIYSRQLKWMHGWKPGERMLYLHGKKQKKEDD